ncbi:MAG: DUF1015 family protein [Candidatus Lokiarchaeota archaeon]|nr:DUF1015 family protein [Candidatus Lokiarchaeota archaeon]
MPELIPFRNFHYKEGKKNPEKLSQLIAPPYDVISDEEIKLFKQHPDNICHIILPNSYKEAGQKLDKMIKKGKLTTNEDRCICIYGIDYERPDTGQMISRYGFVGLLRLVEIFPANDGVIPHESVFKKFLKDRLELIKETDGNFSPIFTIYNGNGSAEKIFKKYINKEPSIQAKDRDGFVHKIWEVWKEKHIQAIQNIVKNNSIIIADGHHRYITSLRHSKNGGCKYIMALFIDFNDPGLIIYTSHRQIHKMPIKTIKELENELKEFFQLKELSNIEELKNLMEKNKDKHVFGCYFDNKYLFCQLNKDANPERYVNGNHSDEWKKLNVPILHQFLLKKCLNINKENISFIKDINKGIENVDNGKIDALFIINPTTLEEVHKITHLGEIMPQKSTYFYPKPLSGLIIHKHTEEIE